MRRRLTKKGGMTLVEVTVCLLLISMLLAISAAALSSATKSFYTLQSRQYAQSVLDTVLTEVRSLAQDATDYVELKHTDPYYTESTPGSGSTTTSTAPNTLEFKTTTGHVARIHAEGTDTLTLLINNQPTDTFAAVDPGQLLTIYYSVDTDGETIETTEDNAPAARAAARAYGTGFYMGRYLKLTFEAPDGAVENTSISYVTVTAELYSDEYRTDLLVTDSTVIEFRYDVTYGTSSTAP